jgi:hypothetical protein
VFDPDMLSETAITSVIHVRPTGSPVSSFPIFDVTFVHGEAEKKLNLLIKQYEKGNFWISHNGSAGWL